jgi:hypothetical protein
MIYNQYSTAASGTVAIMDNKSDTVLIHEAASLAATLTITFPATPVDGQQVTILSVKGVTAVTATSQTGTLATALTAIAAGTAVTYMYSTVRAKWYRTR